MVIVASDGNLCYNTHASIYRLISVKLSYIIISEQSRKPEVLMVFDTFFTNITRLLMTLMLLGAVGTLILTAQLACDPHAAVSAYHSVGLMAEHVLAGGVFYLALSLICAKIRRSLHDTNEI